MSEGGVVRSSDRKEIFMGSNLFFAELDKNHGSKLLFFKGGLNLWETQQVLRDNMSFWDNRYMIVGLDNEEHTKLLVVNSGLLFIPEEIVQWGKNNKDSGVDKIVETLESCFALKGVGKENGLMLSDQQEQEHEFSIQITETLRRTVAIKNKSGAAALQQALDNYNGSRDGYILDYNDHVDTSFTIYKIDERKREISKCR